MFWAGFAVGVVVGIGAVAIVVGALFLVAGGGRVQ